MEELTKTLVEAKQSAEAERDKALAQSRSSIIERNEAVRQLQEQEADIQQRISQAILTATKKKDNTIRLLQGALEASQKNSECHCRYSLPSKRGVQASR